MLKKARWCDDARLHSFVQVGSTLVCVETTARELTITPTYCISIPT
jgi:hypothetical protein